MHFLEIHEVAARIQRGELSSREVTEAILARVEAHDSHLSSYSQRFGEEARREAAGRDAARLAGEECGPLHGVPIAVKDLFAVAGTATTAGTRALAENFADSDSTAVARLRGAGAVIIGKLKMSEGAFAAHHPDISTPLNPWGDQLWLGASSSGSAAATAAGLCFGSLGSDTGGSIRFPSAAAGLSGLKPTWGRVSRAGMVEFAGTLDCPGPIARSVRDCAILYDVIAGADDHDPITLGRREPQSLRTACNHAEQSAYGRRIGIDPSFLAVCDDDTRSSVLAAATAFEALGAIIVEVALPSVHQMVDDWTPACAAEAAAVHAGWYDRSPQAYGAQLAELVEQGLAMSAGTYREILRRRERFAGRMRAVLSTVDAVLLQVTGTAAPSARYLEAIGVGPEWRDKIMMATCPINAAGLPAMTIPGGATASGAPIGFQLVGRPDGEAAIVGLAHAFQTRTGHHTRRPPAFS
ncbi:amidase [Microbacterium sp. zg.B48]|uniref:amidase n=1 Tax=Microbacterium sp. zg.B48 TaxID=2969408 RepID=UPI00214B3529|nr:amidase [Microbacterium sp. zg.B48]MCR2762827.1 amidase [Microbacterium sp. zg.B48]